MLGYTNNKMKQKKKNVFYEDNFQLCFEIKSSKVILGHPKNLIYSVYLFYLGILRVMVWYSSTLK